MHGRTHACTHLDDAHDAEVVVVGPQRQLTVELRQRLVERLGWCVGWMDAYGVRRRSASQSVGTDGWMDGHGMHRRSVSQSSSAATTFHSYSIP